MVVVVERYKENSVFIRRRFQKKLEQDRESWEGAGAESSAKIEKVSIQNSPQQKYP